MSGRGDRTASFQYIEEEHEVEAGRSAAEKNKNRSPPVTGERRSAESNRNTERSSLIDASAKDGSITGSETSRHYFNTENSNKLSHLRSPDALITNF